MASVDLGKGVTVGEVGKVAYTVPVGIDDDVVTSVTVVFDPEKPGIASVWAWITFVEIALDSLGDYGTQKELAQRAAIAALKSLMR